MSMMLLIVHPCNARARSGPCCARLAGAQILEIL